MTAIKMVRKVRKAFRRMFPTKGHQTEIVEYVIKSVGGRKRKVGVLVGRLVTDHSGGSRIGIGWSRAAINRGDAFIVAKGLEMAKERALESVWVEPPPSLKPNVSMFIDRCGRYFQDVEKWQNGITTN